MALNDPKKSFRLLKTFLMSISQNMQHNRPLITAIASHALATISPVAFELTVTSKSFAVITDRLTHRQMRSNAFADGNKTRYLLLKLVDVVRRMNSVTTTNMPAVVSGVFRILERGTRVDRQKPQDRQGRCGRGLNPLPLGVGPGEGHSPRKFIQFSK